MTVTVAYERLAGEGFVTFRQGAGTFVSEAVERATRGKKRVRPTGVLEPRAVWDSIGLSTAFARPARYDFRTGLPDPTLFPHRAWERTVMRALLTGERLAGTYGHAAGHPDLRSAIARQIGFSRGVDASADDVVITSGAQQALDLIARVLFAPGDQIAVEDPGYQPPRLLFKSLGLQVLGVPVDRDGLVVEALPPGVRAVYVTPSHQYPLAVAMTLSRRRALLAWAERNNAAIIEDDYDCEFRFSGRPIEPLQTIDTSGRVIYVSSFSKTMLPSLRLGFLIAPPCLQAALHKAKYVSDWHAPTVLQAAVARFIEEGALARHIRRMTEAYRERHEILTSAIGREFADHLELIPSTMGLHLTALARRATVEQLAEIADHAAALGVGVHLLSRFAIRGAPRAGVVFGFGAIPTKQIAEGLRRFRSCFDGVSTDDT